MQKVTKQVAVGLAVFILSLQVISGKRRKVQVDQVDDQVDAVEHRDTPVRTVSDFGIYLNNILYQVHPGIRLSRKARSIMNSFVVDMLERVGSEAGRLSQQKPKGAMGALDIKNAVESFFPDGLAKHAVSEGAKAVTKYTSSKRKSRSRSYRAGLELSVTQVEVLLKNGHYAKVIGKHAPIYMAAVLEFLAADILHLGGNAARDNKKSTVEPRHLQLAVRYDDELNKLLSGVHLSNSYEGVIIPRAA